ncbi:VWA-like domain-containing protein [Apilactobacillus sp. M161]|uniref:VWA-like domain-containing protein n=1 Tax=Apilactobacillus xinyiensis TaxID=2841032 RepID=A0ABT0I027_9LACO|nr:VWA-like domain-containing protein [Apilactobacillus xinyiensis]MCK8624148.1 VWA-like domain-containing protein [Apilactobacillus xinyiensis]
MDLDQALFYLNNNDELENNVHSIINHEIIKMLNTDNSFYANLLIQLPKLCDYQINHAMGLIWHHNNINLAFNPERFKHEIKNERTLIFLLKHLSLHIAWLHPIRYNTPNVITDIACDLAINQYIDDVPSNVISIDKINFKYNLNLPHMADSSQYVSLLMKSKFFDSIGQSNSQNNKRKSINDDHSGWQHSYDDNLIKTATIKNLVEDAISATSIKHRGIIDNNLKSFIQNQTANSKSKIDWNSFFKLGNGNINFGIQTSYSRFNRRQPYRMDLPGKITNYAHNINIFIDNSGSMTNNELSFLLQQLQQFLKKYNFPIFVYPFDTKVDLSNAYNLNNYNQVRFEKFGSGGTTFQTIFNFLHDNSKELDVSVILTDGKGEKDVHQYHCFNTFWVLTEPMNNFSLNHKIIGKAISVHDQFL